MNNKDNVNNTDNKKKTVNSDNKVKKPELFLNPEEKNISSKVKHKLLVMSGKGGVGKTTVAINLAFALAKKGYNVGLLDVDVHGPDVPKMLNLNGEVLMAKDNVIMPVKYSDNLKVVSVAFMVDNPDSAIIWRGPLKHKLIKQCLEDVDWGNIEFLVVDFPPGTGDENISAAQLIKGAKSIIVSTPQSLAIQDAVKTINFSNQFNIPVVGIIENMSGSIFGEGTIEDIAKRYKVNYLGKISMDKDIVESGEKGAPVVSNNSRAEKEMNSIIENIIKNL